MRLSAMDRYCSTELENRDKQSSKYDDVERMMAELFGLCDSDKIATSENQHKQEEQKEKTEIEINQGSSSPETEDSWQVRDYKGNSNSILLVRNRPNNTEKEEEMYNSLRQRRKLKRKQDNINRIREKVRCIFQDSIISPNKSESDEDRKIISECLERRRLEFASNNSEFNDTLNDVTTEEEAEDIYEMDKIRKRKRDMSANNLQGGTESVASRKSESVNSSDSTICIENNRLHDFTDDEETDCNSDKTSTRKRNMSVDTSQKDIGIPMKIQRTENSSVIVNITSVINQSDAGRSEVVNITQHDSQENQDNVENVNLADTDMKISTDIRPNLLATKEVNMQDTQENVTSADEDVKILKDIRPNLTLATKEVNTQENQDKNGNINLAEEDLKDIRSNLSSMLMQELISSIKENDSCDVSKNMTTENDEAITKIVNVSIRNLDKDSTNKKTVNDIVLSKISDSSDNQSSTDDDNMSDIEVEIKIKPKSKSRISKKFSLKASLSAVNTCFKNLNTLKKNPDFLGELFQMNFKTPSENLRHGNTNEENGTKNTSEKSLDVNQDITAEAASNTQEVTCNSSHTKKDNAELSSSQQQEQSTQNNTILDKDKNEIQSEGANIHVQSDQQTRVTDGNNSESSTSDKEKTTDEQQKNPPKIVDLESGKMRELNQEASNAERIKGRETAAKIDVESTKSVPESQKQLPKTSSETSDAKCSGEVRVQTSAELGYMWSSNPINLSMNSDASNGAHSMPSASSIYKPPSIYNSAANPAHHPPTTNVPADVPTEIIPPNLDGNVMKSLPSIVVHIYFNFHICRRIIEKGIFSEKKMYDFEICLYRIYEDIRTLKMMLRMTNNDDIINYINQYKLSTIPLSTNELARYATFFDNYLSSCMGYSNVLPQPPTDNNSVQSAPIPNAQAPQPPFSGNIQGAPVPGATSRTQPSAIRTKSSAVPQPGPNINQSQFSRSTVNPLHSRLPSQSFCPQVPPTNIPVTNPATNPMINLQQPMKNANYVQGQRMSSMFTVNNNQQPFVNPSIGLHAPMAPPSASNTNNIRTNRRNINVSSANAKKYQSNVSSKSTTAAAPATNMQQQMHQVPYSQMLFHVNSGAAHLLTMNQNANILPNVYYDNQPSVHTNISVPINANVTGNLMGNIGLVNPPANSQMQFPITPAGKNVPQYNVNVQTNFTSQSAYDQNILLIQNQQQQHFSHLNLSTGTSIDSHLINAKNNVSQNAQPSMPNKGPAGIPETQTKNRVPSKTLFAKSQRDAHQQGAANVHNVSQEPSVQIPPKTSVSQKPGVSQNATSHTDSQTDKTILISQINPVASSNKSIGHHFDVSGWTTREQIRCRNQLHYYLEYCLNKQPNSETLHLENKMLIFFYTYLKNKFKLIKENNASEKASTVPNRQSVIRSSCSEIQSNNNSQSNESSPFSAQNTLNLLQNDETKDNVEGSGNARTSNLCNISNVTISNSSGGNKKTASQIPCNAEVQDKEVDNEISMCNLNNKIPDKNSQDKTRENVQENSEKSIFTDTPRASSTPFILDETSGLLIPTNRTSESIAQTFTFEPDFFTREDPANEQTNDSGKAHDSFESLGRLHIDESAKKLEKEQDDKESSSGKDKPNTSQDSCFHETNRESAEMTLSFVDDYEASLLKMEENSRKVKKNLSLMEMQAAEKTPDVPEDISNTRASTPLEQSINTVEGTKKNQAQMDTYSSVKAINELFKHVSDDNKHCAKPRTSPTKKSNVYKAKIYETAMLLDKNATSNVSPAKSKDENSGVTLNITNVSSIPLFLFEKMDNEVSQDLNYTLIEMKEKDLLDKNDNPEVTDSVFKLDKPEVHGKQEEDQSLNVRTLEVSDTTSDDMEKEKLSNINDGLEEPDEIEDRPCLRCERKSTVYCQDCLKAPYCSKRCQRLNWISTHHKECNARYKSANQPDQIICID